MAEAAATTTTTEADKTSNTEVGAAGGNGAVAAEDKAIPSFWEAFNNPQLKIHPSVTKFKSAEDLAQGLVDAEKRLGVPADQLVRLPTKPDDAEAWSDVFKKLGRPDTPEGYKIELPAEATPELKDVTGKLAETAHKAGLNPNQLRPLVDLLQAEAKAAQDGAVAAREAQTAEVQKTLRTEWGAKYEVYAKEIGTLVIDNGGQPLLDELNASGLGNSLALNRMLAKLVDRVAEPERAAGEGGRATGGDRPLTPQQARAERARLEGDETLGKALRDGSHPQHKWALDERNRLIGLENAKT